MAKNDLKVFKLNTGFDGDIEVVADTYDIDASGSINFYRKRNVRVLAGSEEVTDKILSYPKENWWKCEMLRVATEDDIKSTE